MKSVRDWEHRALLLGNDMSRGGHPVDGARMRRAMDRARLTIKDVADSLDVNRATVHRWFSNDRTPEPYLLERFAALVGEPAESFWINVEDAVGQRVVAALVRLVTRMTGQPPMPAINALSLEAGPVEISAGDRHVLTRREEVFRAHVQAVSQEKYGRPWQRLTFAERAAIVEGLMGEEEPANGA